MAILVDGDRAECLAELMRDVSTGNEACGVTKADLRAAIDAADAWVSTNASAFNTALPQPARAVLTAGQKARLLSRVALKRFVKGV